MRAWVLAEGQLSWNVVVTWYFWAGRRRAVWVLVAKSQWVLRWIVDIDWELWSGSLRGVFCVVSFVNEEKRYLLGQFCFALSKSLFAFFTENSRQPNSTLCFVLTQSHLKWLYASYEIYGTDVPYVLCIDDYPCQTTNFCSLWLYAY